MAAAGAAPALAPAAGAAAAGALAAALAPAFDFGSAATFSIFLRLISLCYVYRSYDWITVSNNFPSSLEHLTGLL